MRLAHPGWGRARSVTGWPARAWTSSRVVRRSIVRVVRNGLITPQASRRKKPNYERWETGPVDGAVAVDIVGWVRLVDGSEAKVVTGVDDHSRFCVSALIVARATARQTCEPSAMRDHGIPAQVLTDNGKVFIGRFGPGTGKCCSIGSPGARLTHVLPPPSQRCQPLAWGVAQLLDPLRPTGTGP